MSEGQTVFILNPKHEQFPAGREWLMQDNVTKTRFAIQTLISFGVMFLAALIFYVFASSPTLDFTKVFFGGIPVGLFALATLIRIRQRRRYQLYAEGQLLAGALVKCKGKSDPDSGYYVKVTYQFQSPSGKLLSGKASCINNNWDGFPLPTSGTPVQILYVNDSNHMML